MIASAAARVGRDRHAGRWTDGDRLHYLPLVAAALYHSYRPRARLARSAARRLRALAADRGDGADAAVGRGARGRGSGCDRHFRHCTRERGRPRSALRGVASWPIKALSMHCVVYEITDGRPVPDVLAALSKDRRVVLAQPLHEFHTLTVPAPPPTAAPSPAAPYNDPLYDLQTNLLTLGIARAHERSQGAGVRVALIDTGVDARHPDLAGRILDTQSFVPTLGSTASHAPSGTLLRHGTAMAGLIPALPHNHIGILGIP